MQNLIRMIINSPFGRFIASLGWGNIIVPIVIYALELIAKAMKERKTVRVYTAYKSVEA